MILSLGSVIVSRAGLESSVIKCVHHTGLERTVCKNVTVLMEPRVIM